MTAFAKKTMKATEWAKVQDQVAALQVALPGPPHDLMMLSAASANPGFRDIYIGLPAETLLVHFPGFTRVDRSDLPDFLVSLVCREDGFREMFPDIWAKQRSREGR